MLEVGKEIFVSSDVDERISVGDLALVPDVDAVSHGSALVVELEDGVKGEEEDGSQEQGNG